MKPVWTKFWHGVSACLLLAMTALAAGSAPSPRTIVADLHALPSTAKRVDELELAGLRPGRDTLTTARKLYGGGRSEPDDSSAITWRDPCRGQSLHVEAGDAGVIQFITVQAEDHSGDCRGSAAPRAHAGSWRTGRGLALGDAKTRVIDLYGAPNSGGPSTDNHQELDMLYYAFDWAGSDVPQVMEVYSDRATGRVAEITLSGPSL